MGDGALIGNGLEAPWRVRHAARWPDRHHHRRPGFRLLNVDPDRSVPGVIAKCVPDVTPHPRLIEPRAEHLPVGRVKTREVQAQSPHPAVPDLHRGEVPVVSQRHDPQLLRRGVVPVDLDACHSRAAQRHPPPSLGWPLARLPSSQAENSVAA